MPIEIHCPIKPFKHLYNLPKGTNTIICIGGRGGGKTYQVSQWIAYNTTILKKRCVVVRDEKSLIKESILNEIWARYDSANEGGILDNYYSKNETELKEIKTGKTLIYTKGFRASDNQKKANLKGASDIDIAIIEEGEDIVDQDRYNVFVDSLRKSGCIVIILLNVPDIGHFLLKNYFYTNTSAPIPENCPEELKKEYDGYFQISPKAIPGFVCIHTGFEDNPYLPSHIISRYKSYGDPASHLYNPHYYLTAIKGYASTGRKGQILKKVKEISLKDYMALPFKEFYGQDFGTASPAGLVGVKFDKNNCYCREINYLPMNTLDIAKLYCRLNFGLNDKIIADSADKEACEKLAGGYAAKELSEDERINYPKLLRGFFVEKCVKGDGSIRAGISVMDSLSIYAVRESTNLWKEIRNYVYAVDKNGNLTNDPIDDENHCLDPLRYVIFDQRGKKQIFGI